MSPKPEPPYNSIQPGRTLYTPQTPYSAVSSFNLPAHYDLSLMTPVTMSESPAVPAKTSPSMNTEKHIKLSPTSPTSDNYTTLFTGDDDFGAKYSNPPMKHKNPTSSYGAGTPDSGFPCSPLECPIPYFGAFAVSGGYTSTRDHGASPVIHQSPNLMSAGGVSNSSRNSRQPTPGQQSTTSYRSHNQTPILIAPNPGALRKNSESSSLYHRQNSIHSTQASTPQSQGHPEGPFPDTIHPSTLVSSHSRAYSHSSASRKRKSPEGGFEQPQDLLHFDSDLTYEESLLLQLSDKQELPWKEVVKRFNEKTGKAMKVPALQMRKKRLIERLRACTGPEVEQFPNRCSPFPISPNLGLTVLVDHYSMGGQDRGGHPQAWLF